MPRRCRIALLAKATAVAGETPAVKHRRAVSDGSDEFWAVGESLSLTAGCVAEGVAEPTAFADENES